MFGQIPPTSYDLRLTVFGIPVRVHPVFWLTSAMIGWIERRPDLVLVNVLCVFLSVLVHELGHAIVTRCFGWNPEIVLYFFGGYATTTRHSTWKSIAVLIAGPALGFSLFFMVLVFKVVRARYGLFVENELIDQAVGFLLFANLAWNILNLIPVCPLDGGQICRELFCWFSPRNGLNVSLVLSIIASAGSAILFYRIGFTFAALFFAYMGYQSYQAYQSNRRGYW